MSFAPAAGLAGTPQSVAYGSSDGLTIQLPAVSLDAGQYDVSVTVGTEVDGLEFAAAPGGQPPKSPTATNSVTATGVKLKVTSSLNQFNDPSRLLSQVAPPSGCRFLRTAP